MLEPYRILRIPACVSATALSKAKKLIFCDRCVLCIPIMPGNTQLRKSPANDSFNEAVLAQLRQGYVPSVKDGISKIQSFLEDAALTLSGYDVSQWPEQQDLSELTGARNDLLRAMDNARTLEVSFPRLENFLRKFFVKFSTS